VQHRIAFFQKFSKIHGVIIPFRGL